MKVIVLLLLILAANAKIFERCELARALKAYRMDATGVSLANWVCLIKSESGFNTQAIGRNRDGSTDYGIFQINSRYWCYDGRTPGRTSNDCKINCSRLLSADISQSVKCAKIIAKRHGTSAWYGWKKTCANRNVRPYIAGCGV
ncbi:lysozyme C II-like [Paramisgurnus dabryanus]|uniref:lysozyme C II-like n=1 Tax=Paramisgurnus dabryanus TaxID=90735 RepID=UPI0031F43836